jgi:hypothetical protein
MIKITKIVLASVLLFCSFSLTAEAITNILNYENFEFGVSNFWYLASNHYDYNGNISSNYSLSPNHSYRFELHNGEPAVHGGIRSELAGPAESPNQEMIYNFSCYLPNGGNEDWGTDKVFCDEMIAQWHQTLDVGDTVINCGPPLSLKIYTSTTDGLPHFYISQMYDEHANTTSAVNLSARRTVYDLGPITKGQWLTWSFHVRWGWMSSQNPYLQVYKNGALVLSNTNPNMFNDRLGVSQQLGIYKWEWDNSNSRAVSNQSKRVIYFDDVSTTKIYNVVANGTGIVTDGLVVSYNGNMTGNTLTDLSKNGNNGNVTSGVQGFNVSTKTGFVQLTGRLGNIEISNNELTNVTNSMTVEFIGSINQFARYEPIVCKSNRAADGWWLVCSESSPYRQVRFGVNVGNRLKGVNSNVILNPEQIYDIVATYDGSTSHIYINGDDTAIGIWDSPITPNSKNITIGGFQSGFAGWADSYNMTMYSFRLYNRALTASEVLQNYGM